MLSIKQMLPSLRAFARSPRVLLLALPFILLAPVWLTGRAMYWGTPSTQFVPWLWQAWRTLLSGELPLWNPLVGMGAPLLANYQSALLYPPTWLYLGLAALGGLPLMAWGQAILVALHLALAAWGMALLLRRLYRSELAQVVGGLAFALSGYLVARAHFLSINSAVTWLPWILLAAYNLVQTPRQARYMVLLALAFAMQWLAGHAQTAWYTLLLAMAWTLFWIWRGRLSPILQLSRFILSAALAFALSAAQLLPTIEYLLNSQRATQVDFAEAATYSFWPLRLITLIAPNFFGNPAHGNYWGYGNYWEDALYVGMLPLSLAILALFSARRDKQHRPLFVFLAGLGFVSLMLALGGNTPLFRWLYDHVPSFSLFQSPTRFSIWLVFALAVLVAFGVDAWRTPTGRGLYWSRLLLAGSIALLGTAALASLLNVGSTLPASFAPALVSAGIVAVGAAALNLRLGIKPVLWPWLVSLLVAADLLYAGWGLNPGATLDLYRQDERLHAVTREALGEGRLYLPPEDERYLKFERLFRFDDFVSEDPRVIRAVLLPNTFLLDGLASVNNFDPFVPVRYRAWLGALETALPDQRAVMLQAAGVSVIEEALTEEGASVVFNLLETEPRARVFSCATWADASQEAFGVSVDGGLALEGEGSSTTDCTSGSTPAQITKATANAVIVQTNGTGGWLLLADTWYPGWTATVNGESQPVLPANGVFRAVAIPAGEATVVFAYQPSSFLAGALLSLGSLGALGAWRFWRPPTRS